MRKSIAILFLVFTTFSFAQQSPNSIFNYRNSSDDLISLNSSKLSLNMDSFKLEDLKQNTNSLSELPRESYNQRVKPTDNMPIFAPKGKFYLKIYGVDEDIDYKLKIFIFEESKYYSRSVG